MYNKRNAGFTIVELSLVIVIIGLMVAATLTGISLLQASKVRSVISDASRFKDIIARFEQQYGGLPGDLTWGTTAPFTTPSGTTLSAGNGDGIVQWSNASHPTSSQESYQAWLHLQLSELFTGSASFSGAAAASNAAVINTNVPASKIDGAGYSFYNIDNVTGGGNDAAQFYATAPVPIPMEFVGNYIAFGAAATNSYTSGAAVTGADAQKIDSKVDDGVPNTGTVLGTPYSASRCITATSVPTNVMQYDLTTKESLTCNLYFRY